ncbi:MAG: hypothetical protein HY722_00950 [Planctomycetes bacterium]|nr:hypothetical protein [Planctomycetota bacterium]
MSPPAQVAVLVAVLAAYPALTFLAWYVRTAYFVFGESLGRLLPAPESPAAELALAAVLSPLWLALFPLLMPLYLTVEFLLLLGERAEAWLTPRRGDGAPHEAGGAPRRFVLGVGVFFACLALGPLLLVWGFFWSFLVRTVLADVADRLRPLRLPEG